MVQEAMEVGKALEGGGSRQYRRGVLPGLAIEGHIIGEEKGKGGQKGE